MSREEAKSQVELRKFEAVLKTKDQIDRIQELLIDKTEVEVLRK